MQIRIKRTLERVSGGMMTIPLALGSLLYRRTGPADLAEDDGHEFRLTLFKYEVFLANDEEEEVAASSANRRN
jgi:hypothetical protein